MATFKGHRVCKQLKFPPKPLCMEVIFALIKKTPRFLVILVVFLELIAQKNKNSKKFVRPTWFLNIQIRIANSNIISLLHRKMYTSGCAVQDVLYSTSITVQYKHYSTVQEYQYRTSISLIPVQYKDTYQFTSTIITVQYTHYSTVQEYQYKHTTDTSTVQGYQYISAILTVQYNHNSTVQEYQYKHTSTWFHLNLPKMLTTIGTFSIFYKKNICS